MASNTQRDPGSAAATRQVCGQDLHGASQLLDLKAAEVSRLAAVVECSEDAIITKTLDGIIVTWNEAAERVFGYTSDEIIGRPVTVLMPPDRLNEEAAILARLRRGERIEHYETVRQRKDGTRLDISLSISPIKDAGGQIIGASKIARDITRQKQTEAALLKAASERDSLLEAERAARSDAEHLSRLKDEFLATLSHELRTPLNAVLGWTTLLRRLPAGSSDYVKGLETIERNARAQSRIIEDLLDMSSIISGKVQLVVRPVNLNEVVQAAVDTMRPAAEAKRLRLSTSFDSATGVVLGDANRLQQVLWNLLNNAVKFTPVDGFINISLEQLTSHVEIRIEDSGIGIEPDFIAHVFDRFRQADASSTREHDGLGLGLAIVKNLVELHGGFVRAESGGRNRGSTFIVTLPTSNPATERRIHPVPVKCGVDPELIDLPSLQEITVLVVDDQTDARELLGNLIGNRGGRVLLADSAQQALEILGRETIDVLVSDVGMPAVDGYELMRRVRNLPGPVGRIPAIAVTAYARPDDRQKALRAGFQLHLPKPLEAGEVVAGIASLARLPR